MTRTAVDASSPSLAVRSTTSMLAVVLCFLLLLSSETTPFTPTSIQFHPLFSPKFPVLILHVSTHFYMFHPLFSSETSVLLSRFSVIHYFHQNFQYSFYICLHISTCFIHYFPQKLLLFTPQPAERLGLGRGFAIEGCPLGHN